MRNQYSEYIIDIKKMSNNNFFLYLNNEEILEEEILKKYYINFLGINYFIITNKLHYEQIKKYNNKAKIFYIGNNYIYNIDDENEQYYFCRKNLNNQEINNLLQKINNNNFIDFIIPYANTTEAIRKCIAQNIEFMIENSVYKPHFILICDGTDDEEQVKEITKKYANYILYLNTNNQSGAYEARNLGIDHSFGKRVIFWDADDLITDKYLADELYLINDEIDFIKLNIYFIPSKNINNLNNLNENNYHLRVCVNKTLIDKYNLRYVKIYKEEDTCLYNLLEFLSKKQMNFNQLVGIYNYAIYSDTKNNLAEKGSQKYGNENAILSLLISKKILIDNINKINNQEFFNKIIDEINADYNFWLKNATNIENVQVLFQYAFKKIYKQFNITKKTNFDNNDIKLNNIFALMINDNIEMKKTIDTFKEKYQ